MAGLLTEYSAMVPDMKRRGVVEVFTQEVPILQVLNFMDIGDAMGYDYNVEASLGGIGFRALNGDYAAGAKTAGLSNPVHEGTAIMGGTVPMDRQLANNTAFKANKIAAKAKAAAKFFARQFFDGDTTVDPKGFDGINRRIANANLVYAGANGGYIDIETLCKLLARVPGSAADKRLLMSEIMQINLGKVLRSQGATNVGMAEWAGPLAPKSFNGTPIVLVGEDESGNEILGFDETRGNVATTGSIYPVRFGGAVDEEHLQGIARRAAQYGVFEVEEQGRQGVTDNVLIEGRLGLAAHHPRCITRYAGIKEGVSA